ncbi:MAG: hypothetical protein KIT33_02255 [Candidatus Kapabacteria bacterium]|nr:hypothetical protein [Ignavibacteriota bacterium]MCW5883772.1 hypothetical protein [Candidatus Kapabacteria bacterium]
MRVIVIFVTVLLLSSCDEINKLISPSDDYLLDRSISVSWTEQTIESGSDFKMIIPANSISSNLEVKVKKEGSVPAMSIPNLKAGKNFYRIKFSGDVDFLKPVNIIINYDKSAIPAGKTAQESVFGYIYSSGSWKLADYQLDEPNGKIIISISSINGKTDKDEPILLDDGEIIIGDAYTTTDTGQGDHPLAKFKFLELGLVFDLVFDNGDIVKEYNMDSPGYGVNYTWSQISWNGNYFTVKFEKNDTNLTPSDSTVIEISGEVRQIDNDVINNEITIIKLNYDKYHQSRGVLGNIDIYKDSFVLYNVKLTIPSKFDPDNWPCSEWITGTDIEKYLKDIKSYRYLSTLQSDQTYKITEIYSKSYSFEQSSQIYIQFNAI